MNLRRLEDRPAGVRLMAETWDGLLKLIRSSSPLGEGLRAAIYYVVVLLLAYLVILVNATAGAVLTLILVLVSIFDLLRISEASLRFLMRRLPSALVTTAIAYLLGQSLDYVFGVLFLVFLFIRLVERYL